MCIGIKENWVSSNTKYKYKQYTMTLDMDQLEDKEISDFLIQSHRKRNNFNDQLKAALKNLIEAAKQVSRKKR